MFLFLFLNYWQDMASETGIPKLPRGLNPVGYSGLPSWFELQQKVPLHVANPIQQGIRMSLSLFHNVI